MGRILPTLNKQHNPLADGAAQVEKLRSLPAGGGFEAKLDESGLLPYRAAGIEILQLNVGKKCNQTCHHCHVDAGPDRTEVMPDTVLEQCMKVLQDSYIPTVDITGGAPELHPRFREIVERSRSLDRHVIDRCNLTVLLLPNYADLPEFFARHSVELICSLPYYTGKETDSQRGEGVFEESLTALRRLNDLGYGKGDPLLQLNLVTNPVGAFLPANQAALERDWKREIERRHGIDFDHLYTITNMPIARFLDWLIQTDNLDGYMERLIHAYNPAAAGAAMCRSTLSVSWDGRLFDCDFNQMLDLPVNHGAPATIFDFDLDQLDSREIVTAPHCFGCAAGAGSSCGGTTTG